MDVMIPNYKSKIHFSDIHIIGFKNSKQTSFINKLSLPEVIYVPGFNTFSDDCECVNISTIKMVKIKTLQQISKEYSENINNVKHNICYLVELNNPLVAYGLSDRNDTWKIDSIMIPREVTYYLNGIPVSTPSFRVIVSPDKLHVLPHF